MQDSDYWYGLGWMTLRKSLSGVCLQYSGELFDCIGSTEVSAQEIAGACSELLNAVASELNRRVVAGADSGMWQAAISLLGTPTSLATAVSRDLKALRGDLTKTNPDQALRRRLNMFFESARREIQIGKPGRRLVWERLDRLSRIKGWDEGNRCNRSHFAALADRIRKEFPSDRNLPRTIDGVEGYFLEFCAECVDQSLPEIIDDRADADVIIESLQLQDKLFGCMSGLKLSHPLVYEAVIFCYDLAEVRYISVAAFCAAHSIDMAGYRKLVRQGLSFLRDCIAESVAGEVR